MSRTRINYDVVVEELSKGLAALDSEEVLRCNMLPHLALAEFRTIRFGSGRQRGTTGFMLEQVHANPGKSLILTPAQAMCEVLFTRYVTDYPLLPERRPLVLSDYPDRIRNVKFSRVFIEDAGIFFKKYSYDRVFKYLAECTTPNVVIYLIN